ncbi:uncharacterized protein [Euwallacea similis]|uniref:uncharacterized protein isoform X1 n=2 Tax=Euwallacea similis TaxID=1736056 RepID=UPI00344C4E50
MCACFRAPEMDFKNAPKKRTTNFREDETKLLIQLWGSPVVQHRLYLTHRKAPVMKLIASNMQKHGFYRTPDEIKTRIRNLKCLYHRIKKSMATGAGIGTVDPDWPHYKAMDDILSKKNALQQSLVYNHNLLSDVNAEIKEEDIEINDDGESSNSNGSDDEFDETPSALPATITPLIIEEEEKLFTPIKIAPKPSSMPSPSSVPAQPPTTYHRIQIAQNLMNNTTTRMSPNVQNTQLLQPVKMSMPSNAVSPSKIQTIPTGNGMVKGNGPLPIPLLILNGVQGQSPTSGMAQKSVPLMNTVNNPAVMNAGGFNAEVSSILKEMLMLQRENLEIERERLKVEKQKLEYERTVGSELLKMAPSLNEIFHRFNAQEPEQSPEPEDSKNFAEHPSFKKTDSSENKRPSDGSFLSELQNSKVFKEGFLNGL